MIIREVIYILDKTIYRNYSDKGVYIRNKENKKEVFIAPEYLKIGKLKLSEILAKQQECNNFVDIKIKQAERDFTEFKEKTNKEINELQNEVFELKRFLTELVNFAVEQVI